MHSISEPAAKHLECRQTGVMPAIRRCPSRPSSGCSTARCTQRAGPVFDRLAQRRAQAEQEDQGGDSDPESYGDRFSFDGLSHGER